MRVDFFSSATRKGAPEYGNDNQNRVFGGHISPRAVARDTRLPHSLIRLSELTYEPPPHMFNEDEWFPRYLGSMYIRGLPFHFFFCCYPSFVLQPRRSINFGGSFHCGSVLPLLRLVLVSPSVYFISHPPGNRYICGLFSFFLSLFSFLSRGFFH